MTMVFARKQTCPRMSLGTSKPEAKAAQGILWDPTMVGRSFSQAAMTFRSGDGALRERLHELELRRRRAQIKARRVIEESDAGRNAGSEARRGAGRDTGRGAARVEQPVALPFAS